MNRYLKLFSFIPVTLLLFTFAGCSNSESTETESSYDLESVAEFTPSDGFEDNGLWENLTALDHVELGDYIGISIPADVHSVTDEALQAELETILGDYSSDQPVTDRAIVDGDTVNIDYVGSIDGVEFEGGSTKGAGTDVTIGVTSYIDDFLEQLIGHTPGESFDIEVTFPVDYGKEDLNGKDAIFAITVNYITEAVTPELTDEFVMENLSAEYGWTTVAEMETETRDSLQNTAIAGYIQKYVVENSNIISLPDALLQYQEMSMLSYYLNYADYYDMEFEEFLSTYMGVSTMEELLQKNKQDMTDIANFYLVSQAIAEDAGISVDNNDLVEYFKNYIGVDDYSEYEENFGIPYLMFVTLNQKVVDYIADNAVLE